MMSRLTSSSYARIALHVHAQLAGWVVFCMFLKLGWLPGSGSLWPWVFTQGAAAGVLAVGLGRARWWWLPIHLFFMPLALIALGLGWHPGVWLAAFVALVLIYWSTFRTQVPLFLTNRRTAAAVAELLPSGPTAVLDIGCGIGSLLVAVAGQRPDARLTGIENAPAPFALARLRARRYVGIEVVRGDFFARSWAGYDLIYAFLSPVPMAAVWEKAQREMKPGSLLVSNGFAIPDREPDRVVEVADRRRTRLLLYQPPPKPGSFASDFSTASAG